MRVKDYTTTIAVLIELGIHKHKPGQYSSEAPITSMTLELLDDLIEKNIVSAMPTISTMHSKK